jgi:hypothetical protein
LSVTLIGRERGLALDGRASRQNSATAEAACKQPGILGSIQSALTQWDDGSIKKARTGRCSRAALVLLAALALESSELCTQRSHFVILLLQLGSSFL